MTAAPKYFTWNINRQVNDICFELKINFDDMKFFLNFLTFPGYWLALFLGVSVQMQLHRNRITAALESQVIMIFVLD